MSNNTTVIDIIAKVTDKTGVGAASAIKNLSKLEQAMQRVQIEGSKLQKMSKIEMTVNLIDNASKTIASILNQGKELDGKIWTVTLKRDDKSVSQTDNAGADSFEQTLGVLANIASVLGGIGTLVTGAKGVLGKLLGVAGAAGTVGNTAISVLGKTGQLIGTTSNAWTAGLAKTGVGLGSGATTMGGAVAAGSLGLVGGLAAGATLISAGTDFYKASTSTDKEEAAAYTESAQWKTNGVAWGALAGSLILPGLGTLIGAGLGGIAGWIMGDNTKKRYEQSIAEAKEAEAAALLAKEQAKYTSRELKKALADSSVSPEQFSALFQQKVAEGLQERFRGVSLALSEIQAIANQLTFGNATESLNTFAAAVADVSQGAASLQNTTLALEKLEWKANLGLEWTEADASEFTAAAESMMSGAQKYLQDKHYEATTAINLLFGDNDSSGIIEGLNGVYADLQQKGADVSSDIRIKLDSDISKEDKQAAVSDLLSQLSDITSTVTNAQNNEVELDFLKIKYGGADMDASSFLQLQAELPQYIESAKAGYDEALKTSLTNFASIRDNEPEFDWEKAFGVASYEEAVQQLSDNYQREVNAIDQRVLDFQMEGIENAFQGDADKILPGLEGTLSEKIQQVYTSALRAGCDLQNWNTDTDIEKWATLFGLEDDKELAGQLALLFQSMASTTSKSLVESMIPSQNEALKTLVDAGFTEVKTLINGQMLEAYVRLKYHIKSFEFDTLPSMGVAAFTSAILNNVKTQGYAEGGILDSPHVGLVAEDGAEAIIPLSGKRRQRGLDLWERAGELLGVKPYAEGAIIEPIIAAAGNGGGVGGVTVPVNIDNVTFEAKIDGGNGADTESIVRALKDNVKSLTDEIAYGLALSLKQVFANLPKAAEGV